MLNNVLVIAFFVLAGVGWRLLAPQGINGDTLQRQLTALSHFVVLPAAVFFILFKLPMNEAALRILFYVLGVTALTMLAAWLWLWKSRLPPKTKGAYFIAASFGNVLFLGLPLNKIFMPDWSMRVAVEYGLVANVLLLFTVGAALARSFAETGKGGFGKSMTATLKAYDLWLKEPLIWSALAALALNLGGVTLPAWLTGIEAAVYGLLVPLLILSAALALKWNRSWPNQLAGALPVPAIQLILVPLLMWGTVSLFGSAGLQTTRALLLDSMMPATLFGLALCDRYKLDSGAYTLALSLSSVLAILTVPVWFKLVL